MTWEEQGDKKDMIKIYYKQKIFNKTFFKGNERKCPIYCAAYGKHLSIIPMCYKAKPKITLMINTWSEFLLVLLYTSSIKSLRETNQGSKIYFRSWFHGGEKLAAADTCVVIESTTDL